MYHHHKNNNSSSLAIVSSVLFPNHTEGSLIKRRRVNLQCLPGAWIEEELEEEAEEEKDEQDKENNLVFIKTVSATPPKLPLSNIIKQQTSATASDEDIELLKQTIDNLRKEKQKLEETNDIVKKSIQIVARKRFIAQTSSQKKKKKAIVGNRDKEEVKDEDEDEDIYIVVPSDFMPTQDEMKAAGLDGWEWISAY